MATYHIRVSDYHVEVGQSRAVCNVLRQTDAVFSLVEPRRLIIDILDGDGGYSGRSGQWVIT